MNVEAISTAVSRIKGRKKRGPTSISKKYFFKKITLEKKLFCIYK
jgi:hypothetical protein